MSSSTNELIYAIMQMGNMPVDPTQRHGPYVVRLSHGQPHSMKEVFDYCEKYYATWMVAISFDQNMAKISFVPRRVPGPPPGFPEGKTRLVRSTSGLSAQAQTFQPNTVGQHVSPIVSTAAPPTLPPVIPMPMSDAEYESHVERGYAPNVNQSSTTDSHAHQYKYEREFVLQPDVHEVSQLIKQRRAEGWLV